MNSQPAIPVGKNRSRTRSVGVGVGGGRRFAFDPRLTLAIVLVAMIVLFAILQPVFLTSGNLLNILLGHERIKRARTARHEVQQKNTRRQWLMVTEEGKGGNVKSF